MIELRNLLIDLLIKFICAIIVVCVHEYPKIFAYKLLVHPLYKKQTNISYNPMNYIDPFGIITFMFMNVGWQKPFVFNNARLKDKSKGLIAISLSGILANLLLMTILIPIFYSTGGINPHLSTFLIMLIYYNFGIVIVNLLPVPPLDMVRIVQSIKPHSYFKLIQYEKIIQSIFILALAMGILSNLVNILFKVFRII
ncbi:MAG: site-2 protease family protein [Vallitalea sp.]|jgi:Zn-dependent protease|nr:site-2 protease family protein [Vallitalea sp.]